MDNWRSFSLAQALYVHNSPCAASSTAGLVQRAHTGKDACGSSETAASMSCDCRWDRILVRFLPERAVEASGMITEWSRDIKTKSLCKLVSSLVFWTLRMVSGIAWNAGPEVLFCCHVATYRLEAFISAASRMFAFFFYFLHS